MSELKKIRVIPTLIIGLGGTGSLGIQFAKNSIRQHLMPYTITKTIPDKIPFIQFFSIDTTEQEREICDISGDEFEYIGALTSREIKNMKNEYAESLKWFPNSLSSTQINAGARGVRQLGRLCFFKYKSLIEKRFTEKINRLKNLESIKNEIEKKFVSISLDTEASRIDIHLISSMGGGTGSSCLLDVAFLLRHLLKNLNPRISAHLVGPEAFDADSGIGKRAKEYIKYNFAVTLAEIERFIDIEQDFSDVEQNSRNSKSPWRVKYLESPDYITVSDKPFDFIYLLGERAGGDKRKVEQICETIGLAIAIKTVRPEAVELRGKLENIPAHVTNQMDGFKRNTVYSSYNAAAITADLDEIAKEHLKFNLQKSIFRSILKERCFEGELKAINGLRQAAKAVDFFVKLDEREFVDLEEAFKRHLDIKDNLFTVLEIQARKTKEKNNIPKKTSGWGRLLGLRRNANQPKENRAKDKQFESKIKHDIETAVESEYDFYIGSVLELERKITIWREGVENSIINKIAELLVEGCSLLDIEGALKINKTEIENLYRQGNVFKETAIKNSKLDEAIERLLFHNDLSAISKVATQGFHARLFSKISSKVSAQLEAIANFLDGVIRKCGRAKDRLDKIEKELSVNTVTSFSTTNNSIFKMGEIDAFVQQGYSDNLKSFVEKASQNNSDILEFLAAKNNNEKIHTIMGNIFEEEYNNCIKKVDGIFSKNYDKPPFEAITENGIHDLISLSTPLWSIEKAGQMIEPISLVNIDQDTHLGKLISNHLGAIFFKTPRNSYSKTRVYSDSLIFYQSEHGSCAAKLNILESCMLSVSQKLRQDGKSHIRDLSLDPEWEIQDPLTGKAILDYYAQFSLAMMFKTITFEGGKYFFLDETERRRILGKNFGFQVTKRFEAFSSVIGERVNLENKVKGKYDEKIKNPQHLNDEIENHIQNLEDSINRLDVTDQFYKEKLEQYQNEIKALKMIILPGINEAMESSKKDYPQNKGQSSQ